MRIIDILHSPWAIRPDRLIEIGEIYSRHLRGEKISRDTIGMIEASIGKPLKNEPRGYDVVNGVAVIPVDGVLAKRMNLFMQISGGTSTELLARDFNAALADPSVRGIILNIDSPGGTVDGTQEFADMVYAAKDKKPVCAYCNGMMASAAYWIGSAAQGGVFISGDTVDVGSIGVVTTHTDYSRAYDAAGVKVTELTAGEYKRIASEYAPLTESGRAYIQEQLDHIYGVFLSDVGRNRGGMNADQVHERMANGRIFIGSKAVEAGLADGMMSLPEMIDLMSQGEMPMDKMKKKKMQPGAAAVVVGAGFSLRESEVKAEAVTEAEKEMQIMNVSELQEKHPDLYQSVLEEGKALGIEDGKKQGAAAEVERIKAVKAVARNSADMEALEPMMFDGKTTGPEAAVKLIELDKAKLAAKAEAIKKDGEDLKVAASTGDEGGGKAMKRSEFNTLAPAKQAEFVKGGGRVID